MGKIQPNTIRQQPVFCYTFENIFNNFAEAIENITNIVALYRFDYFFINFSDIKAEKQSDLPKYEKEYKGNIFVYKNESDELKYKEYNGYVFEFTQEERMRRLICRNIDFYKVIDSVKIYTHKDLSKPCIVNMTVKTGQPPFYAPVLGEMAESDWIYLEEETYAFTGIELMRHLTEEDLKKYKFQYENGAIAYMETYERLMDCDFLLIYSKGDYPVISHLYFSADTNITEKLMKERKEIKPLVKRIAEKRKEELKEFHISTPFSYMGEFFDDTKAISKLIDNQEFAFEKLIRA